ncbi:MBL fold metallo-hydrolase [Tropicimonas sp. IMCC34043]|uniref:MBL fold metallo-hydrolase n=1 Tax=Tropicimonas sp. IMCC34043 TaxID=2248760 RepID=UPI0013009904|nr:MBL fold metallo-hydrolase [Tropicimonas sp. IMCC34043]
MQRRDFLRALPAAALAAGATGLRPLRLGAQVAADDGGQVLGAQRFQIGDAVVTALSDGFLMFQAGLLNGVDPAEFDTLVAQSHQDPADLHGPVNAYLVETGGETWLIDTGTGTVFGPTLGHLGEALGALGVDPGRVSRLVITHLHGDHIGGATAAGVPVFDTAEMIVTEAERDFWTSEAIRAAAPEAARGFFDLAAGALAAYGDRVRYVSGEVEVAPGLTAVPLPGHTPGHTGYLLESGGESLLFWGDAVVVWPVQLPRPAVSAIFDVDPAMAATTRADLLASVSASGQMVAGMHMGFPGVGYVEAAAEGYRFVPAPWQYF